MTRLSEYALDGSGLKELPGIHHRDCSTGLGYHRQVVRYVDNRHPRLFGDSPEELQDLVLDGHIQGGGGLIAKNDLGLCRKRNSDQNPLAQSPDSSWG